MLLAKIRCTLSMQRRKQPFAAQAVALEGADHDMSVSDGADRDVSVSSSCSSSSQEGLASLLGLGADASGMTACGG